MADDTDASIGDRFEGLLALLRELAGVRRDLDFVLRQQGQLELERRRLAAKNAECRSKVLEAMAVERLLHTVPQRAREVDHICWSS
jgi:hypothetical protein